MPLRQVEELIEKMKSDAAFRGRVLSFDDVDARMEFIKTEGFECKKGDIQLHLQNYADKDGCQNIVLTEKGGCNGIYYGFCF